MDWSVVYAEFKGWQGAIGSVLGFIALICGALFNFRLNRKRDERLRNEEIVAVACALYGEIVILRQSVARMANAVGAHHLRYGVYGGDPIDTHFIEQFELPMPKLYPALASKVGMLQNQLALEVVRFYARVEEAETWLPLLKEDRERPHSYGVNSVLDPAVSAVIGVTPALRIIEDMAGIAEPAGLPELRKALDAQQFEALQNERP